VDLAKQFGSFPLDDRRDAWDRLGVFVESWFGSSAEPEGVSEAELASAERRLGAALPAAVREAYLRFGLRQEITALWTLLIPPCELRMVHDVLVVWIYELMGIRWGIRRADFGIENPPVVVDPRADENPPRGAQWLETGERFVQFFVGRALMEAIDSSRYGTIADVDLNLEHLRLIERSFPRLDFPGLLSHEDTHLYGGDDVLFRIEENATLAIAAPSVEAYERAIDVLGDIAWDESGDAFRGEFKEYKADLDVVQVLLSERYHRKRRPLLH
jgi:hypothetical protein